MNEYTVRDVDNLTNHIIWNEICKQIEHYIRTAQSNLEICDLEISNIADLRGQIKAYKLILELPETLKQIVE